MAGLLVLFSASVNACDLDAAKAAAQDASDYSRKAKNASDVRDNEGAYEYSKRAYNASEDVISYLSDCEENTGENN